MNDISESYGIFMAGKHLYGDAVQDCMTITVVLQEVSMKINFRKPLLLH